MSALVYRILQYDGKNKRTTHWRPHLHRFGHHDGGAGQHGSDAITGAGGTITKDVPDGALAIERADQRIIEGYTELRRARL